jgi:phthalate 4,5-cis-dihydrodiol dehydrogenase
MSIVRLAFIGAGEQGMANLLPALMQVRGARVCAVCDVDQQKVACAVEQFGIAAQYTDYQKMIETEKPDAVILACPPQVHFEITEYALHHDTPVFVEKPPALFTHEVKQLARLAVERQVITGVGLNFRYAEPYQLLSSIVEHPEFGEVTHFQVTHLCNKPKAPMWGLASVMRSFLLAQAIHPIDLLLYIGGSRVINTSIAVNYNPVDGSLIVAAQVEFANGSIGNLQTGTMFPYFHASVEVTSSKSKKVTLDSLWNLQVFDGERPSPLVSDGKRWNATWSPSPLISGYGRSGYLGELQSFVDAVRTKQNFSPSLEDQIPVYEFMDQIEQQFSI